MRQTASEAWRLHAKAWTLNEEQNVAKLMLTCLVIVEVPGFLTRRPPELTEKRFNFLKGLS